MFRLVVFCLCSHMATAGTFYLDPENGSLAGDGSAGRPWPALAAVVDADYFASAKYTPLPYGSNSRLVDRNPDGPIRPGDTLMLLTGQHGAIVLRNHVNDLPITVMAAPGHTPVIERVRLQGCRGWVFDGLSVSSEPYGEYLNDKLFYVESHGFQGPCRNITVKNCHIYSTETPWTTAAEWVSRASDGLCLRGDSLTATGNLITNVDMALTLHGDHQTARGNHIVNFSGDGIRILGSHNLVESNLIKNCYDVDDNHDDGIQSWTTNGLVVDHNRIIGNTIINTDDPDRPLNGPLQGIGCFDGFYNDWTIANNVVHVNHWHGITLLGARNCRIVNNTVLDPTPTVAPGGSWIRIGNHKDGRPSTGCTVANNVVNDLHVDGISTNNRVLATGADYAVHFVDPAAADFRLLPTSELIDAADPEYAPATDFTGSPRGPQPDIGAYEYVDSSEVFDYMLFRPGVQYLYENPDFDPAVPTLIETQYYGVRVQQAGRDSLYGSLEENLATECVRRVASPFGYTLCQSTDSTVLDYQERGKLTILHNATKGQFWTARPGEDGLTAEVVDVLERGVLGIMDSVKTILIFPSDPALNTIPDTIRISRSYGLVEFPRYYTYDKKPPALHLAGITGGPTLGRQMPSNDRLEALRVGDQIDYERIEYGVRLTSEDSVIYNRHIQASRTIESIDSTTASYRYYSYRETRLSYLQRFPDGAVRRDSLLIRDTLEQGREPLIPTTWRNVQPGARVSGDPHGEEINSLFIVILADASCNMLMKRRSVEAIFDDEVCGYNARAVDGGPGYTFIPFVPLNLDTSLAYLFPQPTFIRYLSSDDGTCGTPLDFSDITIPVRERFRDDPRVRVFPNPTRNLLNVQLPPDYPSYELSLFSADGRRITHQDGTGDRAQVNTENLAPGMYLLLITENGRPLARRRVAIQH